jgi:hypothetical protein
MRWQCGRGEKRRRYQQQDNPHDVSHGKSPKTGTSMVRILNHKWLAKSRTNAEMRHRGASFLSDRYATHRRAPSRSKLIAGRAARSPSKLEFLQPLNILSLIGNDLRLPDDADAHHAHGQDANHEDQIPLRFRSGLTNLE